MPRDHNDAEYDLAMQPGPADTRTHEQRKWDKHKEAVNALSRALGRITCRPWLGEQEDPYGFHHRAGTEPPRAIDALYTVSDLVSDLDRELSAMRVMGNPYASVKRVEAPRQITTRPAGSADCLIKSLPMDRVGVFGDEAA